MNDLDICKRIAEIEYDDLISCYMHLHDGICIDKPYCGMVFREAYNPLTDDALCFRLMVKYDMPPSKLPDDELYECVHDMDLILSGAGSIVDKSPNKAICLAIIEANK